ncbi:MAG TPA: DUF6766 family protein [Actinomycetota bacterium]|nr:DUF6766 family protein [Actinomycetota bacterium]
MASTLVVGVTVAVLLGVTAYLIGSLVQSVLRERKSNHVRKIWRNFGLSLAFCVLFLISWGAQGLAEWEQYRSEQRAHGEPVTAPGFAVTFAQSTLENWQSEFLQLFSFVVLSSVLIHRGSAESKDGTDRIEGKLDEVLRRSGEEGARPGPRPVTGR